MAAEAEVTGATFDAYMFGIFLGQVIEIGFVDHGAVELDGDFVSINGDYLLIPLTDRFEMAFFSRLQGVESAVELVFLEFGVFFGGIIEHLDLHAGVGRVARAWVVNAWYLTAYKPLKLKDGKICEVRVVFDTRKMFGDKSGS